MPDDWPGTPVNSTDSAKKEQWPGKPVTPRKSASVVPHTSREFPIQRSKSSEIEEPPADVMKVGPLTHTYSRAATKTSAGGKTGTFRESGQQYADKQAGAKGVILRSALSMARDLGLGTDPTPGKFGMMLAGALAGPVTEHLGAAGGAALLGKFGARGAAAGRALGPGILGAGAGEAMMAGETKRAIENRDPYAAMTSIGVGAIPGAALYGKIRGLRGKGGASPEAVPSTERPASSAPSAPAPPEEPFTIKKPSKKGGGDAAIQSKPIQVSATQTVRPGKPGEAPDVGSGGKGAGGKGQKAAGAGQAQTGAGQAGQTPQTPKKTGVAQRVRESMAKEGRAEPYQPGTGASPEEMKNLGRSMIASGTDPIKHLAMMEKRGESVSGRDMAVLAAHDDALVIAADKARDASRANPADPKLKAAADKAVTAERKWYDRISKFRTEFQKIGTAQQGEVDVDTGSFTSLSRHFETTNKRTMTPQEEATADTHVKRIKELEDTIAQRDAQIAQAAKTTGTSSRTRTSKTGTGAPSKLPTDPAELAKHFAKRKADGSLYAEKPLPKQAGAVRFRQGDPNFTTEEVRRIWDHAGTYIGKKNPATGRMYETADAAAKAAADLGLTTDEVLHAFTRNKVTTKVVTDQMYADRSARRQAKKDALAFVEGANTHPVVKGVRAIPNVIRSSKVFGHGMVGMTTHGGPNLFMPFSERAVYWPGQVRQLGMALNRSLTRSEILHEKMMTDVENHPLYNTARQSGLKVDTYRAQDDIQAYARFLGGTGNLISRLSKRGDMGMDVLKWARMKDFALKWDRLDPDLKTPDMAKELSNMVNHSWGAGDSRLGKAGGLLFSPSLQAAHWARVVGDPYKTLSTFADVALNKGRNTSPAQVKVAKMRIKRAGEFVGVFGGTLAVNQAMLKQTGQQDTINFTDPTKSDWLQHKWRGRTIASGMSQGPIHILSQVARDVKESDVRRLAQDVFRYGEGKVNPAAGMALETGLRRDYFGRPLPFASQEMKDKSAKAGKEPVSWGEYLWSQSPIPAEGIAREYFEQMRDNGVDKDTSVKMWKALAQAAKIAPAELLGFRVGHTPKPQEPKGKRRSPAFNIPGVKDPFASETRRMNKMLGGGL